MAHAAVGTPTAAPRSGARSRPSSSRCRHRRSPAIRAVLGRGPRQIGRQSSILDSQQQQQIRDRAASMTKSPKRFSAGVVIVRPTPAGWRYLLLRVYRTWDFPKGGVEAGETALQAAIREVQEETSLTDLSFDWGEVYCETRPYSAGKIARYYLAVCRDQPVRLPINAML